MVNLRVALTAFVLFVATVISLFGQSYQGSVRGLVTDDQGAAIPKAQVSLVDQATSITRVSVTNQDGQYVFSAVEPTTYTVSIIASGFASAERKFVIVGPQQFLTVDFKLSVGSVAQRLEVTASTPPIDQVSAANNATLTTRQLEDLPVPGRNPYVMAKMDSNVIATGTPAGSVRFADQTGVSSVSVSGGPLTSNNYLIDGVPATDITNKVVIIPTIEATDEMTVQKNSYDAEIGRTGGATFTTVLKSGTDVLHGTLYGETRQTDWTAKPYFFTPGSALNADFYDYAGAIGGPIVIPHLYNGRHKTFFWLAEEGYRQLRTDTGTAYVPTALERIGDFSQSSRKIYDPFAPLVRCPPPSTQMCRQQFPGNKIPANLINPAGLAIVNKLPLPNQPVTTYGATDFSSSSVVDRRADDFSSKLDQQLFSWWQANFAYLHFASKDPSANILQIADISSSLDRKVDLISQHNTFLVSPSMVVTVGYGFNRFPNLTTVGTQGLNQTSLGFPANYAGALQQQAFPQITMQQTASQGVSSSGLFIPYSRSLVVGLAKSSGRHSLAFGYDFRSLSIDFFDQTSTNGQYSFTNLFSEQIPNAGNLATGADVADLLLGTPASGQVTLSSPLKLNVHYHAIYAQDNIRVTSRFAFTAGLRYEYELGVRERNDNLAVGFNRSAINPLSSSSGVTTLGGIEFAGVNGDPIHCCDNTHLGFAPRLGIIFSPRDDISVRAGYGIFHPPLFYTNSSLLAPGYTQSNTYVASNDGNVTPAHTLSNPFPSGLLSPSGNALGYLTGIGNSVTVLDQYRRTPFVEQYSADIQKAFPGRIVMQIGYVGLTGRNLQSSSSGLGTYNINQLPDQDLSLGSKLTSKVSNPYFNEGGTGVIGSSTVAFNQLLRPFPEFASVNIASTTAESLYNALNLRFEKQMSQGLSIRATYTWSSNWDSTWGTTTGLTSSVSAPQDAYNLNAEYARSLIDTPNRFALGAIAELPFGSGKRFLSGNGLLSQAVGGWSVNAIGILQNGEPLSVSQSVNGNASIGAGVQRPNLVGNPCYSGSPESRSNNYLNVAAFSTAAPFTYGDAPRTLACYGPGVHNWDISVYKTFKFERFNFQFRAEALNAFNTPQFASPVVTFGTATFGQISNTVNNPRFIELGGKMTF